MTGSESLIHDVRTTRFRILVRRAVVAALVYGAMGGFIAGVYLLTVGIGVGVVGSGRGALGPSVIATALVAVTFEPVRKRVQREVNRLIYGRRASPYEVLADLADRLAETESTLDVLGRMARLMADGTGADQATVWLSAERGLVAGAGWPAMPKPMWVDSADGLSGLVCPVAHDGEQVGALQVVEFRGSPFTPVEQRLLTDLAGSAGLVLGNQRLNAALSDHAEELRASRARLLRAQDMERYRLEQELHDGTEREIVALQAQVLGLEQTAGDDGVAGISDLLAEVVVDLDHAIEDIRSLARGLYLPVLETEGLEAAVTSAARDFPTSVEVECKGLGRHSKAVESALYFVVSEAMTNAVKHGEPTLVRVRLSECEGYVSVEISDDGAGFDIRQARLGVGLSNIRDRIEARGGEFRLDSAAGFGTTVSARVPSV
jgi:signal transduction histidine kinase